MLFKDSCQKFDNWHQTFYKFNIEIKINDQWKNIKTRIHYTLVLTSPKFSIASLLFSYVFRQYCYENLIGFQYSNKIIFTKFWHHIFYASNFYNMFHITRNSLIFMLKFRHIEINFNFTLGKSFLRDLGIECFFNCNWESKINATTLNAAYLWM